MTISEATSYGMEELEVVEITTAQLDSEVLLAYSLNVSRESLFIDPDLEIDTTLFFEYLSRRKKHEPVAYITNKKEFYGRDFFVDKRVLIPRPDTEVLIDKVLDLVKDIKDDEPNIVDLGTGSGAIALTLALEIKKSLVLGIDIEKGAIEVSKKNAELLNVSNVSIVRSNFFKELKLYDADIMIANLPYVPTTEKKEMMKDVLNFEPEKALFSGKDGLDHYRKLIKELKLNNIILKYLIIEIYYKQVESLQEMFLNSFGDIKIDIIKDLGARDRGLLIKF